MLQKLNSPQMNRIRLADALVRMDPSDFDMRTTSNCICGHALRMFGEQRRRSLFGWHSQLKAGAALLGITPAQASQLFCPPHRSKWRQPYTSPQEAARVLRYLAATDTVDWSVADKPLEPRDPKEVTQSHAPAVCMA